jgi:hypothetical protein
VCLLIPTVYVEVRLSVLVYVERVWYTIGVPLQKQVIHMPHGVHPDRTELLVYLNRRQKMSLKVYAALRQLNVSELIREAIALHALLNKCELAVEAFTYSNRSGFEYDARELGYLSRLEELEELVSQPKSE